MADYRSRIHENFTNEFLVELEALVYKRTISDNNKKSAMVIDLLKKYKIDYINLGSGTNRVAVLIDGYVFKFALDQLGYRDNESEFALSTQLQPFVIQTYESNGLISVCEYVELISSLAEFQLNRSKIINKISKITAQNFLVGDVGFNSKNFCNWGKRTGTNELVILDFAYIYKIDPYKMKCQKCNQGIIEYDDNFINLICQNCGRVIKFTEMRKMVITEEEEQEFIDDAKEDAVQLKAATKVVKEKVIEQKLEVEKIIKAREPRTMRNCYYKTSLSDYSRTDGTIFDGLEDERLPKSELDDGERMDAFQQGLGEMRKYREPTPIDDREVGSIRGVTNESGRVSFITVGKINQPVKQEVPTVRYNVSGKKPQNNNQRYTQPKPKFQNNQKPQFFNNTPDLSPSRPQPTSRPISKQPEKVVIPDFTTEDDRNDIIITMGIKFKNAFGREIDISQHIEQPAPPIESVEDDVPFPYIPETVVEVTVEIENTPIVNVLATAEAVANKFASMYTQVSEPDIEPSDYAEEEDDEEEYMEGELPQVSGGIEEALSNFEQTRNSLLTKPVTTPHMLHGKVCPGDPNIKIR